MFTPQIAALAPLAALALLVPAAAGAQARCRPLCAPVLLLQPGLVAEDIAGDASPEIDLNLRLVTAVPTRIARTRLIAGVQWTPLREMEGRTHNEPSVVYGPIFTLHDTRRFALELDVLGAFGPAARAEDAAERSYTHKLLLQGDLLIKAGQLMADPLGRWRDLSVYAMVGYVATGLDERSPWVLLSGVSIPITP
ncbi:MAG TPA: hypothetical protein VMM18_00175 [Gemmatimonadaceae bacterium]|nr:hypothetical protein [Gemmatimonadaceae bacterium]